MRASDPWSRTVPNARCPVCGASVFYYENSFGSRVFFDDLGKPWPKHPCTDRRIVSTSSHARSATLVAHPTTFKSDPLRVAGGLHRVVGRHLNAGRLTLTLSDLDTHNTVLFVPAESVNVDVTALVEYLPGRITFLDVKTLEPRTVWERTREPSPVPTSQPVPELKFLPGLPDPGQVAGVLAGDPGESRTTATTQSPSAVSVRPRSGWWARLLGRAEARWDGRIQW